MGSSKDDILMQRAQDTPHQSSEKAAPRTIQVRSNQIRNAYAVILCCAHYQFAAGEPSDIRRAVGGDVNWSYLSKLATTQGVEPLVYQTLQETSADLLPPDVKTDIRKYQRSIKIRNAFIIRELGRVLQLLEREGIPALVLKGPVLAKVAYGDVNLRRYVDIDVLIPPEHLVAAESTLLRNDYTLFDKVSRLGPYRRALYHYLSQQRAFRRGNGTFNIDLHTHIMPPGMPYTVPFSELWERSEQMAFGSDVHARHFTVEDILLVLCFHGAKNQWSALKHVYDVAALIASVELDWHTVTERARRVRAERMLGLGLLLVQRMVGSPIPSRVLRVLDLPDALRAAASRLEARMKNRESNQQVSLSYGERVKLYLLLQDTVVNKCRYVLYSAARNIWDVWIK